MWVLSPCVGAGVAMREWVASPCVCVCVGMGQSLGVGGQCYHVPVCGV